MAISIHVTLIFAVLAILYQLKENILCAGEEVPLCISEFNQDKECNISTEFGKGIKIYCPFDSVPNNNGVIRMNGQLVNNDNTCFNRMKSNDGPNMNVTKELTEFVSDLIIYTNRRENTHYVYAPHTVTNGISLSCNCIDRGKQKAYKLNIQINAHKKKEKKIKGCNFYYSDDNNEENENELEKNINLKYKKDCFLDVHANDVIYLKSKVHNMYSNLIINPFHCFHEVLNEENKQEQISGLLNGARVIPGLNTYINDPMLPKFLSYLFVPDEINESIKVICNCSIKDNALDETYVGTVYLNFKKSEKLYPVNDENYGRKNNNGDHDEEGRGKQNLIRDDRKGANKSSSMLRQLSLLLILLMFAPW
ncbi:hypothetical protein, conserved [Plasmodium gonderi]|uniref:6-Cys domain-containing protein n=1 Tax=Plasmodium gonderi TaxID=77519 RepID=A0A1Y1JCZ3_PLAGO|nr:hypothetical protein, conserved [Plasmodium gonderi]GAW79225.1 hypothetical protein, conserved [Plasmodium gonderi]